MGFSIGKISFAMALLGFTGMYANYWVRAFVAWYQKTEPPKDRVRFGAIAIAVVFFIIGSVLQAQFDKVGACTDAGYSFGQCFFMAK